MRTIFGLIIFWCLHLVRSDDLSCYFMTHSDGYNCHMRGNFEHNTTITSINGVHNKLKNDSHVEVLFIERTSLTKYLPFGICAYFDNLMELECFGSQVFELTREVFNGCTKLDSMTIQNSKFTSLPTDVFNDLNILRTLEISSTKLSVLQSGLFDKTQNLLKLDLQKNQLAIINVIFPTSVIRIDLKNNLCIDSNFTRPANIIYQKCSNESIAIVDPTTEDPSVRILIDKLNASIISNELEIKKLMNFTLKNNDNYNNGILMRLNKSQFSLENIQNSSLIEQQAVNDKVDKSGRNTKVDNIERDLNKLSMENERRFSWNETLIYMMIILVIVSILLFMITLITVRRANQNNINNFLLSSMDTD
ncbi:hypothetical protein ACKWTF_000079 [Chironomus riparius]